MAALYRLAALLEERTYAPSSLRRQLEPGEELLRRRFADSTLRIGEAAAVCGLTESAFRHRFTRCYGRPPVQFLRDLRLAHAKDLLLSGRMRVDTVAQRCGFADTGYFSRVFKEVLGVPPSAWR